MRAMALGIIDYIYSVQMCNSAAASLILHLGIGIYFLLLQGAHPDTPGDLQ